MRQIPNVLLLTGFAGLLAACDSSESPDDPAATEAATEAAAPPADGPSDPVASTAVLMRGTVEMAADDYWGSVSIVYDLEGEHENVPQTDEEWTRVWAAGITLAETGNLLRMAPRRIDDPEWMRLTQAMIDTGLDAARAADAKDSMRVLDEGEKIYNVCTECHELFMPNINI